MNRWRRVPSQEVVDLHPIAEITVDSLMCGSPFPSWPGFDQLIGHRDGGHEGKAVFDDLAPVVGGNARHRIRDQHDAVTNGSTASNTRLGMARLSETPMTTRQSMP